MKKIITVLVLGMLVQLGAAFADDHHGDAKILAGCEGDGVMVHVYKMNDVDRTYAMVKPAKGEPIVLQVTRTYAQDKLHYFLGQDFVLRIVTTAMECFGEDVSPDCNQADQQEHPLVGMLKMKLYKSGEKVAVKCMLGE